MDWFFKEMDPAKWTDLSLKLVVKEFLAVAGSHKLLTWPKNNSPVLRGWKQISFPDPTIPINVFYVTFKQFLFHSILKFFFRRKNLTSFCKFSSPIRIRIVDLKSIWIILIWIRNRHPLTNYVSVFMQDWRWEVCQARPCSTSFLQPSSSLRSESTIIQQSTVQLVSKFGQPCAQYCWDRLSQKQPLCFMTYVDLKDPNRCAGSEFFL